MVLRWRGASIELASQSGFQPLRCLMDREAHPLKTAKGAATSWRISSRKKVGQSADSFMGMFVGCTAALG